MQSVTMETTEGREGWEGLAMSWSVLTLQGRERFCWRIKGETSLLQIELKIKKWLQQGPYNSEEVYQRWEGVEWSNACCGGQD